MSQSVLCRSRGDIDGLSRDTTSGSGRPCLVADTNDNGRLNANNFTIEFCGREGDAPDLRG